MLQNSQLPPEDVIKLLLEGVSGKQLYHLAQLIDTGGLFARNETYS